MRCLNIAIGLIGASSLLLLRGCGFAEPGPLLQNTANRGTWKEGTPVSYTNGGTVVEMDNGQRIEVNGFYPLGEKMKSVNTKKGNLRFLREKEPGYTARD